MESRGRRSPRMNVPAETPTSQPGLEAMDSARVDRPLEELPPPPEVLVQRISPPAPPPLPLPAPSTPRIDIGPNIFNVIVESRVALARGVEAISEQFTTLARHSIDATAHSAIQMLSVKTWADAVTVNTSLARTSFDHWLDSAAKVSELGIKLAVESAKPFVSEIGKAWSGTYPSRLIPR
jgi:Phasin protein